MIEYLYLGRVAYDEALRLQEELVGLRYQGRIGNVLLLLEHPPVLTLGRNAGRSNVLASDEQLAARGVALHQINRGGDVTYHGPGQLVGYPIFDLRAMRGPIGKRLGPVDFVRQMEEALIRLCAVYGVRAGRIAGLTGVWCGVGLDQGLKDSENARNELEALNQGVDRERPRQGTTSVVPQTANQLKGALDATEGTSPARKIGAIGIHVSRGISSHGFAFNVTTNLRDFELINPCGITDKPVTSLELEIADSNGLPDLESIAHQAVRMFGEVFSEQILAVDSLDALRAQAASAHELPAEDTPLTIPPEVERLHGNTEHPARA